jgi:MFS family permease
MEFTLTFLTHIRFGFTSMQQGKMFFFIGLLMAVLQGGVVRRLPLGSEQKYAMMGLLLIVPSFAIVGSAYSLPTLYLGLSLYAISTAFVVPMLSSLGSQYGGDHQKGAVMGVFRSLGALGRALGPAFGSLLFWSLGPEISYAVGGLLLLIPWAILRSVKN